MKTYSADQVSLSIANVPITGGFADGEFVKIEHESDRWTDVVGTDGEVTRCKTNDRRATVTVLLMQTSTDNDLLSALALIDDVTPGGAGVGELLIRDRLGTTIFSAEAAWIAKTPDATFDREAKAREWKIRCERLDEHQGGNF
ncbi:MAG: DUF3277 family protein [Polyangiaceae bacterium]|nr:DUF3277 family protein [Polyangiaceae bacterium]